MRHAGSFSKSSGDRFADAHAMNCPYAALQNGFEHEIAARPPVRRNLDEGGSLGSGHSLRFSVRLIPYRIKIACGPVHVKALEIISISVSFQSIERNHGLRREIGQTITLSSR